MIEPQKIAILSSALDSVLQAIEDTALLESSPLDDTEYHIRNAIAELKKLLPAPAIELPGFLNKCEGKY